MHNGERMQYGKYLTVLNCIQYAKVPFGATLV